MAETTHSHTEVPGGKETFPPFQKETFASQLFWLTLAFVTLYVIMARIALPQIGAIFEQRRGRIGDDLARAQGLKVESEEVMAGYERTLADARARAQSIANETREQLRAESEERRKVLETKLDAELAEAERAIAESKSRAMTSVHAIAADAAAAIVERLIGSAPAVSSIKSAVEAALKR